MVAVPLPAQSLANSRDSAPIRDAGGSPDAVAALRDIVARQRAALAELRQKTDLFTAEDVRPRLQAVVNDYEALLTHHPDFAAAWAAYGLFLCDPALDERTAALRVLLRANSLDQTLPVVKNQIGVLLAEDGRIPEALGYFMAAAELAPREPLYHFQIGLLIDEAGDALLKTGAWQRSTLEDTMIRAFRRAVELAPDRHDYAYRAAEAFATTDPPRWDDAYAAWTQLEERLQWRLEIQTVRLQRARARWHQGYAADARELLETVTAPELATQRRRLQSEFDAEDAAERAARSK